MPYAIVFPGQGSQHEGMARPWRRTPGYSRWADANDLLGWDVARLGLQASATELKDPYHCQIALFVHHAVVLDGWRASAGEGPSVVAGHSLGEYDALFAAGVVDFASALRLVEARARHTSQAAEAAPGTMVACLGFDVQVVVAACERAGTFVANDNAPGQIVVAGSDDGLEQLRAELADERGKIIALEVGAAYHSPHMATAVAPLGAALDLTRFGPADIPVAANVDAELHQAPEEWPRLLREQLVSPVRWRETVITLAASGVTEVVELCASPVLTGLVKRTAPSLARRMVTTPEELSP